MEALFKKYFWVVKTLGIAAACGLAASAVTTQVGARLLFDSEGSEGPAAAADGDEAEGDDEGDDEDAVKKAKGLGFTDEMLSGVTASPDTTKAKDKQRVGERIRKHNVFCPTCVPVTPVGEEAAPGVGPVDASGRPTGPVLQPGETKSRLPLKIMATMEAQDPAQSLATILDTEAGVSGLFGRGDVIRAGVVVMGVDQTVVHLRNNAALEYIELGDATPPPPAPTTAPLGEEKEEPKPDDRSIPGAEEAIKCPTEDTCTVERAFVEQLMANPALLAKQARIVPKQKDDEVLGYKLYGIRRGSLPKLLGLKNGDMITAVNGEELKSMDKAMALYTKLRRASNLTVSIERKGKTINKEIQIQ
jgi:type II secretion system protein C